MTSLVGMTIFHCSLFFVHLHSSYRRLVILHVLRCCLVNSSLRDHNIGRLHLNVKKPLFISKHQQQFGLIMKARDATTSTVTNAACRFCITFRKEEEVGRKGKATSNVKY